MDWLLRAALAHVGRGNLRVTSARGVTYAFGDGSGAPIAVRFTSMAAQWAVLLDPDLKLGEAYMDGTFAVERGTIADFVDLVAQQPDNAAWPRWAALFSAQRFARRRLAQLNLRSRARRNVAHHYDLDGRLYSLFLDSDRQYSCAYFEMPQARLRTLEGGRRTPMRLAGE
jgi:cyclopropane-fatty-acyl-phospholipid synthase